MGVHRVVRGDPKEQQYLIKGLKGLRKLAPKSSETIYGSKSNTQGQGPRCAPQTERQTQEQELNLMRQEKEEHEVRLGQLGRAGLGETLKDFKATGNHCKGPSRGHHND